MKRTFDDIFDGLIILKRLNPRVLTVNPVANSFPNGAPDNSRQAYICVEVGEKGWDILSWEMEKLIGMGWIPEDNDQYWIHYGC